MKDSTGFKRIVTVAMMAAIGLILQYLAIPFPFFTFLKIDFSDVFVLLPMFVYGPLAGIFTAVLRSALHLLLTGFDLPNMVGDVAAVIASLSFTLPIYFILQPKKNHKLEHFSMKKQITAYSVGTVTMALVMAVANYWVITPLYLYFFHVDAKSFLGVKLSSYVAFGIIPFNLLKGILVSTVFILVFKKLKSFLLTKIA